MKRLRVDIAERLKQLGQDPVEAMVRLARRAEESGNLALAAKIHSDLLEYTAPKLKSMEVSIEPDTMEFLTKEARRQRIAQLLEQTRLTPVKVIEGEVVRVLNHDPEKP